MKCLIPLISILALIGCANLSDPATVVASADTAYIVAVSAEITYESSGKADPKVVSQIVQYRKQADGLLNPLNAQIASGQAPSNDEALAAQTAVTALMAYLTANGISAGSN
jgi:hypothetical protein